MYHTSYNDVNDNYNLRTPEPVRNVTNDIRKQLEEAEDFWECFEEHVNFLKEHDDLQELNAALGHSALSSEAQTLNKHYLKSSITDEGEEMVQKARSIVEQNINLQRFQNSIYHEKDLHMKLGRRFFDCLSGQTFGPQSITVRIRNARPMNPLSENYIMTEPTTKANTFFNMQCAEQMVCEDVLNNPLQAYPKTPQMTPMTGVRATMRTPAPNTRLRFVSHMTRLTAEKEQSTCQQSRSWFSNSVARSAQSWSAFEESDDDDQGNYNNNNNSRYDSNNSNNNDHSRNNHHNFLMLPRQPRLGLNNQTPLPIVERSATLGNNSALWTPAASENSTRVPSRYTRHTRQTMHSLVSYPDTSISCFE